MHVCTEVLAAPLQASYNLTGTGLDPTNATTRKRIQTALRKTLGNGVNATLLDVSGQGSSSADVTSADATSADAATPDATIAGAPALLLLLLCALCTWIFESLEAFAVRVFSRLHSKRKGFNRSLSCWPVCLLWRVHDCNLLHRLWHGWLRCST